MSLSKNVEERGKLKTIMTLAEDDFREERNKIISLTSRIGKDANDYRAGEDVMPKSLGLESPENSKGSLRISSQIYKLRDEKRSGNGMRSSWKGIIGFDQCGGSCGREANRFGAGC